MARTCRFRYSPTNLWALTLDGAHNLTVAAPATGLDIIFWEHFGLSFLLKVDLLTPFEEIYLCGKGPIDLSNAQGWHLYGLKSSGTFRLLINDGQPAVTTIESNEWGFPIGEHFGGGLSVDREGDARFYCNGNDVGGGVVSAVFNNLVNGEPFRIGGESASVNTLKGEISFLRFDRGRVLPAAWFVQEWAKINYGWPRANGEFLQDSLEGWNFGQTLTGMSDNANVLTYNGGGSPAYVAGYPSQCELDFDFFRLVALGDSQSQLETVTRRRAADGSVRTYKILPLKKTRELTLERLSEDQKIFFESLKAQEALFEFWRDVSEHRTLQGSFPDVLEFESIYPGYYQCELSMEEA